MIRAARSASIRNGIGNVLTAVISVRTNPGATLVTRTPCGRSDTRSDSSRFSWAALVAPYASAPGRPRNPATEATPTMWP